MVTVNVSLNPKYGGGKVSTKYSPLLENSEIDPTGTPLKLTIEQSRELISIITEKRIKFFERANIWPNTLKFYSEHSKEDIVVMLEHFNFPPMVVISSNRSTFIKSNLDDLWYIKFGRIVIIVVHYSEYSAYKQSITSKNIIIIGWCIGKEESMLKLLGFGCIRFVALQMMSSLGLKKAWLVDDSVSRLLISKMDFKYEKIPGKEPKYLKKDGKFIEEEEDQKVYYSINKPEDIECLENILDTLKLVAIGFKGADERLPIRDGHSFSSVSYSVLQYFLEKEYEKDIIEDKKILQQLVLWNVDLLKEWRISPYFIGSKEDVTFSEFLLNQKLKYIIFDAFKVLKLQETYDFTQCNLNIDQRNAIAQLGSKLSFLKDLVIIQEEDGIKISEPQDNEPIPLRRYFKLKAEGLNPPIQAAEQLYRKALLKCYQDPNDDTKTKIDKIFHSPLNENEIEWHQTQ